MSSLLCKHVDFGSLIRAFECLLHKHSNETNSLKTMLHHKASCHNTSSVLHRMGLSVIHRCMFKLRPDVNNRTDKGFTRWIFPLMSDPAAAGSLIQSNWFPASLSHCVKNLTGFTEFSNHMDKKYFGVEVDCKGACRLAGWSTCVGGWTELKWAFDSGGRRD